MERIQGLNKRNDNAASSRYSTLKIQLSLLKIVSWSLSSLLSLTRVNFNSASMTKLLPFIYTFNVFLSTSQFHIYTFGTLVSFLLFDFNSFFPSSSSSLLFFITSSFYQYSIMLKSYKSLKFNFKLTQFLLYAGGPLENLAGGCV